MRPPWPYRLPSRLGGDGTSRRRGGVLSRLLDVGGERVVVHAWQPERTRVVLRAAGCEPPTTPAALELAVERMRFALGVDEDLSEFARAFRGDSLIGEAIHHRPWHRPRRRPWPWEALAWAVTEQLIEAVRAGAIQRRMVRIWGPRLERRRLSDVPSPATLASRAPAELAACDLAPSRAVSLIRCAREVASGRVDPADPASDHRLRAISGIGPWTLQCLGFAGRGEPDSLPAGDLAYVKLVGRLAGLRRRATIPEIEEFYAPYEPYRGWAGYFTVVHYHTGIEAGPPLRLAA